MKAIKQNTNQMDDVLDISNYSLDETLDETQEESDPQIIRDEGSQIPVDVYEDKDNFFVLAVVFGTFFENIKVDITTESLKISYSIKKENISGEILAEEVEWGNFSRSIIFPAEIDVDRSFAEISKNGILKITLPKFVKAEKRTLKINIVE